MISGRCVRLRKSLWEIGKSLHEIRKSLFGLDESKKSGKNSAPWQRFFSNEKIKNVYFNFDFSFLHLALNEINSGTRKLILIFIH